MSHVIIFVQVLALLMGTWAIILSYQYFLKTGQVFIKSYFLFILLDNIVAIKVFLTSYLFINVYGEDINVIERIYYLIINPLGLFLSAGLFFFYSRLVFEIQGKRVSSKIHFGLSAIFVSVPIVYSTGIILFLKSGTKLLMEYANSGMIILFFLAVIPYTIWLLSTNRSRKFPDRVKAIRIFGYFYLALFIINFTGIFIPEIPSLALFMQIKYMMILLAMNIFPVIWLRIFFTNCFIEERLVKEDKLLIDQVVRKYGFSDREKEIMALIIEGKSNKEIEEQLFISFHTVKNHIYNIFKKCGVNSRSQLIHLVMKQK